MYYFIIDTDSYSGNFERQLCAYITGQVGECGVGQDIATFIAREPGVRDIGMFIRHEPDDHGVYRPAKIYQTLRVHDNNGYQSVAIGLLSRPSQSILKKMCKRAKEFQAVCNNEEWIEKSGVSKYNISRFTVTGCRLVEEKIVSKSRKLKY